MVSVVVSCLKACRFDNICTDSTLALHQIFQLSSSKIAYSSHGTAKNSEEHHHCMELVILYPWKDSDIRGSENFFEFPNIFCLFEALTEKILNWSHDWTTFEMNHLLFSLAKNRTEG